MATKSYHTNPYELIAPSLSSLKRNLKPALLTYLIYLAFLGLVGLLLTLLSAKAPLLAFLVILVAGIIGVTYFMLPTYRLALVVAKGETTTLKEIFVPNPSLSWRAFGTSILAGLIIGGGFLLFVVPGVIWLSWLIYVPFVVVEEGIGGTKALGRSHDLARNRKAESLGVVGLLLIPQILRLIPFVGYLLASVISLLNGPVLAVRYTQLKQLKADGEESAAKTPVSSANFAFFIVGVIIIIVAGVASPHHTAIDPSSDPYQGYSTSN